MQREMKWKNWPVLCIGAGLVVTLLLLAHRFEDIHVLTYYLEDVAGGITTVILSVATYDEWERRRERRRYKKPENMGVRRIREEVNQLLYQYAFVLNLRENPNSKEMQIVEEVIGDGEFAASHTELHAKAAKHFSQEDPALKNKLFETASEALKSPELRKQSYRDINDLILQTERSVEQIDRAIAVYGYSFTPEVHQWALRLREQLSQTITGQIPILSIRLMAASNKGEGTLGKTEIEGVKKMLSKLLLVGEKASQSI
jgi:hypothetical protein